MTEHPMTILEQAEDAYKQARYSDAIYLYQQELAAREQILGSDHRDLAPILTELGELWQTQEQFIRAEDVYRRALAIYERDIVRHI